MLPPLYVEDAAPWKQRYRAPAILWTAIARNAPARGLVASSTTGLYQLYAWDVPSGALTQITDRPQGSIHGVLSPDGRYVYYLDDQGGNEIGHFVRVPFEGGEPEDVTPDLPPYSSFSLSVSLDGRHLGCTLALSDGFHLYYMDLGPNGELGSLRDVFHGKRMAFGPALSYDGGIAVLSSTERSGTPDCSLLAFDAASGERMAELWDGPESSVEAGAFSPLAGDDRLLATTNRSGVARPLVWNPRTGERIDLDLGDLSGEVHPLDWSPDARRVLLMGIDQAVLHLYVYDLEDVQITRLAHPNGVIGGAYVAPGGEIFATWQDATHPSRLIALDGETGTQTREVLVAGEVPPGHPWRSVAFTSRDGQPIQGWLATPDGDGPFPTILETHGGPTAVQTEAFSPGSQTWLDHGFAFVTINYRGSTTFGRDFERKIWGDLGHWEVEDMVAARNWLVDSGIARPDQILLTGWSYGGYLTLQALGKYPDLWAGGMAGIAIADWAVQYEDSAETLRGYQAAIFGGTPTEKAEQYAASSPISYAERVQAPVLIIQGRNDTRTPARPIEMYEKKMRSLGKAIEVHWFESGHLGAFADRALAIEHQELMLRFAYQLLGDAE